ncbi:MAG: cell division protein FtsZ [Candidatus Cloacimonetes bacterium]|nr:cell division protein FtsZ [Candidatus Cloacimonadota bacterium]
MYIEPALKENFSNSKIKIKMIGVGGAGGNTINTMVEKKLQGVEFIACNTDWGDLQTSKADFHIRLGEKTTRGHGAGANKDLGRLAAEESSEEIREHFQDADLVLLVAGLGKGTGTGASPAIVDTIKSIRKDDDDSEKLVVAIVFFPFQYEGEKRKANAEDGLRELIKKVDTLIVVPNEKIREEYKNLTIVEAFKKADDIIYNTARAITDLLVKKGYLEIDFRDILTTLGNKGYAYITCGEAEGENRAQEAAERAMNNPLLSDIDLKNSKGLLINFTSDPELGLEEFYNAISKITSTAGTQGDVIHGYVIDNEMSNKVRITIIATGLNLTSESYYDAPKEYVNSRNRTNFNSDSNPWDPINKEAEINIDIAQQPVHNRPASPIEIEKKEESNRVDNDIPAFYKKFNNN